MIKTEQSIKASSEEVYYALTNEKQLEQWFPTTAKSNPVVGGAYTFDYKFSDPEKAKNGDHVREGKFLELEKGKKVSYSWLNNTTVHFTISGNNESTQVNLVHEGWDAEKDKQSIEAHEQGWGFFLQNLKSFLENAKDLRPEILGLKTRETAKA